MTLGVEVWCKHPNKKDYYFGTIKNIGHRPRIQLNQLGMHGKNMFPYARDIYPKGAFCWCGECDGDGYVNYSCCGVDMKGRDLDICPTCRKNWPTDIEEECESCSGMGVLKTKTDGVV